ncbi:MAG: chemotaxis protein CheB [Thermodesulfobacteriota bacterium]
MGYKVLVIDDSAFSRQAMAGLIGSMDTVAEVATAVDGVDGCRQALSFGPDMIVLDLEMPNVDGFGFLRMRKNLFRDVPVIVASGRKSRSDHVAAFELGASGFVEKPATGASREIFSIKDELCREIDAVARLVPLAPRINARRARPLSKKPAIGYPAAVAIGASTGGPRAVSSIVNALPEDLASVVVVSMHMPRWLTGPFAERLKSLAKVEVRVAEDGCVAQGGVVLIAPGGRQISFVREEDRVAVRLRRANSAEVYAPSIDGMFASAAGVWGAGLVGVVLTGMGTDGRHGAVEIKKKGGFLIAESSESSAVFSMPRAAISTGMVDLVLDAPGIAGWITEKCAPMPLKLA